MKITSLEIPEVKLIEPVVHGDERGFFYESYREDLLAKAGVDVRVVQDNHSRSAKGVLRGMHYQLPPRAQAKLVRVIRGAVFDVALDIRKSSPTFGKFVCVELSAQNKKMLFVPAGFAHGLLALENDTEVLYKASDFYAPEQEGGILATDPQLGIPWPKLGMPYLFSAKDAKYPGFCHAPVFP